MSAASSVPFAKQQHHADSYPSKWSPLAKGIAIIGLLVGLFSLVGTAKWVELDLQFYPIKLIWSSPPPPPPRIPYQVYQIPATSADVRRAWFFLTAHAASYVCLVIGAILLLCRRRTGRAVLLVGLGIYVILDIVGAFNMHSKLGTDSFGAHFGNLAASMLPHGSYTLFACLVLFRRGLFARQ